MSEQEKNEAIATTGEVTEAKETWLKRLWKKPITKKIVKGIATATACVCSAIIGYKAGSKHPAESTPLPAEGEEPEEDEAE